jgi:hypothetical protein
MATHSQESRDTDLERSFREFVLRLKSKDPCVASFIAQAKNDCFRNISSWTEVRTYLNRAGAEHDAFIGARLAWREYRSAGKSKKRTGLD